MRSEPVPKWLVLLGLFLLSLPCRVPAQEEGLKNIRIELRTRYESPPPETFLPLIPLEEGSLTTMDLPSHRHVLRGGRPADRRKLRAGFPCPDRQPLSDLSLGG